MPFNQSFSSISKLPGHSNDKRNYSTGISGYSQNMQQQ